MERNYLRAGVLVEMDFLTDRSTLTHTHEDVELLFVVGGKLLITVEEDVFNLEPGDMIVINPGRKHSYTGSMDIVMARFLISGSRLQELLGEKLHILFWCNSAKGKGDAYSELRKVIIQILNQHVHGNQRNRLYMQSRYYQLLHILSENFLITVSDMDDEGSGSGENERIQEILTYIRANYDRNISLDDLAEYLFLSPTYVSKYIKQKCGVNFTELLSNTRLNRAMDDLLYTDDSITRIALSNGFASVAAYNRVFKETYDTTPSVFRRERRASAVSGRQDVDHRIIEEKLEEYIARSPGDEPYDQDRKDIDIDVDILNEEPVAWDSSCLKLINAGSAADLLNVALQDQILSLREYMGYSYVRFWDIFAPELYLDIHMPPEEQNYTRLNHVIDFLVRNHLVPYIELGFKPVRVLRTAGKAVREVERRFEFDSDEEMERFFVGLMRNFIRRYGYQEVQKWYFEYWERNNINYKDGQYQFLTMAEEMHRKYFRNFTIVAGALRKEAPGINIGGGGFPVRVYGENWFGQMLTIWKQEKELPDFISINCYPYIRDKEGDIIYEKRNPDMEFVKRSIDMAERGIELAEFPVKKLHVSEYSFSLSNRNVVNDSCIKAAWMVFNALSCLGRTEFMGHWHFSDLYSEDKDSSGILFGGCGLLTSDGITKPSYYAMEFMNRLYKRVAYRSQRIIVTVNERGSVRLVCHNMKKLNFNYYLTQEDEIKIEELPAMLCDREHNVLHISLSNMTDGKYYVKRNRMSSTNGSVQDMWLKLNLESGLTIRELDYLRKSSISAITITKESVADGRLALEVKLEPNELQYIHIHRG